MKKSFNNEKYHEMESVFHKEESKKHFNDIRMIMTEDDCKQVFKLRCKEGSAEDVEKWINQNKSVEFNLTQGLLMACVNGNLPVVKFFIETPEIRKNVNLYVPYESGTVQYISDGVLLHSQFNGQGHIVDYLLYDVNFNVSRDTMNYLKFHNITELLQKIEKRDLFFKISEEMGSSQDQPKNTKLKL
jgi:hypothetical protein